MNPTIPCLQTEAIDSLLTGQLTPEELTTAEEHLARCGTCRQRIERTIGSHQWWEEACEALASSDRAALDDGGFMSQTQSGSPADRLLAVLGPSDDPRMLGRIGPYEIMGLIGQGGMGIVFKGFDAALNRYVAIKMLLPHLATSGAARKRFAREAQAAAAVVDDHVMPIHYVAEWQGAPYFVMPYTRGLSLQKRLDHEGPLELREILRIGLQTARGLTAAHAQGLVHRDIKPANILLDESVERAALVDFGLARAADDASLTQSGMLAGTPQYMSPEQARGETVDQRSDLFSLGSVLYAMCTGRAPFRAETSYGVLRRITDAEPRPIREVNADIPEWLCRIIARLMAKEPAERFESAREVARLLEECLAHVQRPTEAPLPNELVEPSVSPAVNRSSTRKGVLTMTSFTVFLVLSAVMWQGTAAPDISGQWTGEAWSSIELEPLDDESDWYTGRYESAEGDHAGTLQLSWSRLQRRFNGHWKLSGRRYGDLSIRLTESGEIRGALTVDAAVQEAATVPRLRDFVWTRKQDSHTDPPNDVPAADPRRSSDQYSRSDEPPRNSGSQRDTQPTQRDAQPISLAWVPRDAVAVVTVRPARMLQHQVFEHLARALEQDQSLAQVLGIPPAEIEQLSLVFVPELESQRVAPRPAGYIIRARKASEPAKLLAGFLHAPLIEHEYGGYRYYSGTKSATSYPDIARCVFVAHDKRTVIVAHGENAMRQMLAAGEAGASTTAWADVVQSRPDADLMVYAAPLRLRDYIHRAYLNRDPVPRNMATMAPVLQATTKAAHVLLTANTDQKITVNGVAICDNSESARHLEEELRQAVLPARDLVSRARQNLGGWPDEKGLAILQALNTADALLENLTVSVSDEGTPLSQHSVHLQTRAGTQGLANLLPLLAAGSSEFGGPSAVPFSAATPDVARTDTVPLFEDSGFPPKVLKQRIRELGLEYVITVVRSVDRYDTVRVRAKHGVVVLRPGESRLIGLSGPTDTIEWYAGDERKEVTIREPFDYLVVRWPNSGPIAWAAYKSPAADLDKSLPTETTVPEIYSDRARGIGAPEINLQHLEDGEDLTLAVNPDETVLGDNIRTQRLERVATFVTSVEGQNDLRVRRERGASVTIRRGGVSDTALIPLNELVTSVEYEIGEQTREIRTRQRFDYLFVTWPESGPITWVAYRSPETATDGPSHEDSDEDERAATPDVARTDTVGLLEGSEYLPTVLTHRVHELGLEHVVTLVRSLKGQEAVRVPTEFGFVVLEPGEARLMELKRPVDSTAWYAGDEKNQIRAREPFNYLLVILPKSGPITWAAYQSPEIWQTAEFGTRMEADADAEQDTQGDSLSAETERANRTIDMATGGRQHAADYHNILGVWEVVSVEGDGGRFMSLSDQSQPGDRLVIAHVETPNGRERWWLSEELRRSWSRDDSLHLHPKTDPSRLTYKAQDGQKNHYKDPDNPPDYGIYRLEADELTIVAGDPNDFEVRQGIERVPAQYRTESGATGPAGTAVWDWKLTIPDYPRAFRLEEGEQQILVKLRRIPETGDAQRIPGEGASVDRSPGTSTDLHESISQSLAAAAASFNQETAEVRAELFEPAIPELSVKRLREGFAQAAATYREVGKDAIADILERIAETGQLPKGNSSIRWDLRAAGVVGEDENGETITRQVVPSLYVPKPGGAPDQMILVPLRSLELIYKKGGPSSRDYGDLPRELSDRDPAERPFTETYDVSDIPVSERDELRSLIRRLAIYQAGVSTVSNLAEQPDQWFVFTTADAHRRVQDKLTAWRNGDHSVPPNTPDPPVADVELELKDAKEQSNRPNG